MNGHIVLKITVMITFKLLKNLWIQDINYTAEVTYHTDRFIEYYIYNYLQRIIVVVFKLITMVSN